MLYIVGTPIGNLDDLSFRAVDTLKNAELIAAEDTRQTLKLLKHFGIETKMTSYHEHNKAAKGAALLKSLQEGRDIALVTDAGMPAISDPGADLVRLCAERDIPVSVVPGPTAFVTGLVLSGLDTRRMLFEGFLSAREREREERLCQLCTQRETIVFYEAPHKLLRTLEHLRKVFGNRAVAVCRELTKKFEQVLRTDLDGARAYFSEHTPKGEFVLVVEGAQEGQAVFTCTVAEHVKQLLEEGYTAKEAVAEVAKMRNLPKREVYAAYHIG